MIASIVYRPTGVAGVSDPDEFNSKLREFHSNLNKLTESKAYTSVILGDFNFNLRNTGVTNG